MLDVLVRGKGPGALLVPTAVLVGFALVLTLVAMRVFRWTTSELMVASGSQVWYTCEHV